MNHCDLSAQKIIKNSIKSLKQLKSKILKISPDSIDTIIKKLVSAKLELIVARELDKSSGKNQEVEIRQSENKENKKSYKRIRKSKRKKSKNKKKNN